MINVLEVLSLLEVVVEGHFVLKSGQHSGQYINKDRLYLYPETMSQLCRSIARHFDAHKINAVIGPALGGIILTQWVTYHLVPPLGQHGNLVALFAEKEEDKFVFRRGYNQLIGPTTNVLIVEDIVTTGSSIKGVATAVKELGGKIIGVGVLCNRGGVTADSLEVPELYSLCNLEIPTYQSGCCPLCNGNVPINTDLGHGRQYLAKRSE